MRFRFLFAEKKGKIMTRDEFKRLAERPILLDGATGSNLIVAGMPLGVYGEMGPGASERADPTAKKLRGGREPDRLRADLRSEPPAAAVDRRWR